MKSYYAVYKPYGMLSQFSAEGKRDTLASLGSFSKDVYPVGRLDADSEGLLILTNDKSLNSELLQPSQRHRRVYFAQVEGEITSESLENLRSGPTLRIKGKVYKTKPCGAKKIATPNLPERNPPVRFRKNIPTSWLEIQLIEGKNRQVRKMTAAVGFPTLRLARWSIEDLTIENFSVGEVRSFSEREMKKLLKLRA